MVLYALSHMLNGAFIAFEHAAIATFGAIETAALHSTSVLEAY